MKIIQGSNSPIILNVGSYASKIEKLSALLIQDTYVSKTWDKSSARIVGENVILPLTEDETMRFTKSEALLDVKFLSAGNEIIFVHKERFTVENRKNLNHLTEASGSETENSIEAKLSDVISVKPPYIGTNRRWYVWSDEQGKFVDSGVSAEVYDDSRLSESIAETQSTVFGKKTSLYPNSYYSTVDGKIMEDGEKKYIRTNRIPINDTYRFLRLNNYSGTDRIDFVFFNGDDFNGKLTVYNTDYLTDIYKSSPPNSTHVGMNIRSTVKNIEAYMCRADMFDSTEYVGYVSNVGKIIIGNGGNNKYKMRGKRVRKGELVKVNAKTISGISPLAFFDTNLSLVKCINPLTNVYDYMGIAPCDGYVIASSITLDYSEFEISFADRLHPSDTIEFPYDVYLKNGIATVGTYKTSKCIYLPMGYNIVFKSWASSGADVITDEIERVGLSEGISAEKDYWFKYYAENDSIIRLTSKSGVAYRAEITKPIKKLNGKNMIAIGDSYIDGNNLGDETYYARNHVWVNLLAMRNNMTLTNMGANGTTMAKTSFDNCISDRIDSINADFEFIIFEGGRNDFANGVQIGAIALSNTDKATFAGAVQYVINKIYSLNPRAFVLGHPCWVSANGSKHGNTQLTQTDYAKTFMNVCKNNGVLCVNTENNGIAVSQQSFRSEYFMSSSDVSHLNTKGHEMYVEFIEHLLA